MNKETSVNIRITIAGLLMVFVLPFILGTPIYLLGSLMTWSFQISEWHWLIRGLLAIIFFALYMSNIVVGIKEIVKWKNVIMVELDNNPELSIKQIVKNIKQNS